MIKRFDFVFSYWVFTWYILYELNLVKYNPEPALIIGLIENIGKLGLMFYYSNSMNNILLFCIINLFIKVIPLWRLRQTEYTMNDILIIPILFIIYIIWLLINNIDLIKIMSRSYDDIKYDKSFGPLMYYILEYTKYPK
jgi:hypothetical protein